MDDKQTPQLALHLNEPKLTPLHRVGLTGLWMSLKCLEEQYPLSSQRVGNLSWILTPKEIQLFWEGNDFEVLDWLLKQAFQIDEEGLISFFALKSATTETACKILRHNLIRGTFLQHNKFYRSAGEKEQEVSVNQVKIKLSYKKAKWYYAQDFAKKLCDEQGKLRTEAIKITGGSYPGAAVRHYKYPKETALEEPPKLAFAILFAPIASRFYRLSPYFFDERFLFAIIIPEVINLEASAQEAWQAITRDYSRFYACSGAEAILKEALFSASLPSNPTGGSRRFESWVFGKLQWVNNQIAMTQSQTVTVTASMLNDYQTVCQCFPKARLNSSGFVNFNLFRELICENLSQGLPWWSNFLEKVQKLEPQNHQFFVRQLSYQGKALIDLMNQLNFDNEKQRLFVQVCHEALSKIYGKIYSKTDEEDQPRFDRKNQQLIRQLEHCQNSQTFRDFMLKFFTQAGRLKRLQEHWEELMPLATGQADWKIAKSLVAYAIVSYPSQKSQVDEGTTAEKSESNQKENE